MGTVGILGALDSVSACCWCWKMSARSWSCWRVAVFIGASMVSMCSVVKSVHKSLNVESINCCYVAVGMQKCVAFISLSEKCEWLRSLGSRCGVIYSGTWLVQHRIH